MNSVHLRLLGVLAAALAAPLGFLVALHAFTDDELEGITFDAEPLIISPTQREIRDTQTVAVKLSWDAGPVIRAPAWMGTVTAIYFKDRHAIRSGERVLAIDGVDRIAWASPSPFYRTLGASTRGPDVATLHDMLLGLGFIPQLPADPTVFSFATSLAVQDLNESLGSSGQAFDPGTVIWLPLTPFPVATFEPEPGVQAPASGTVIATSPPALTAASLQPIQPDRPISVEPGVSYLLIKGDLQLPFDEVALTLTGERLLELAAVLDPLAEQTDATIERATPLRALSLPATAISANAEGGLCAWVVDPKNGGGYRAVAVTLAGSSLGVTNVATGLAATDQVLANPADVLADTECPSN
jgi:hypothetical protein